MRTIPFWLVSILAIGASGCSIHPLPDDVTRDSTADIVSKIRCEAKKAISDHAADRKFNATAIGYNFEFTITEDNNASGNATFTLPFTDGRFTLKIGAGEDKQRIGERNFLIVENFEELRQADCSVEALSEHWRYPITGVIGLDEVVSTFVRLANLDLLIKPDKKVSTFTDTVIFTTKFRANVDPRIELSPVVDKFKLTDASVSLSADRIDKHKLTITLILPGAPTEARALLGADPKEQALRELDRQRTIQNEQQILDILRTSPIQ